MKKNKINKIDKKSIKERESFIGYYDAVEQGCCDKFGVTAGGIREYVTRLNNIRFAPDRDEVLPKLVEYAKLRTSLNETTEGILEIEPQKADSEWLKDFAQKLSKKQDPISAYLKKARRYARRRRFTRVVIVLLVLALAAAAAFIATQLL